MRGLSKANAAIGLSAGRGVSVLQPLTRPPSEATLSRKGRGIFCAYFASSYVAETSIRTFSSPAATGLLSAAISRLARAYIGIGGGEGT
jgi:hypothetical protein